MVTYGYFLKTEFKVRPSDPWIECIYMYCHCIGLPTLDSTVVYTLPFF